MEASNTIARGEALNALRSAQEPPCVVLLDLMMPVMAGWAFRAAQRADPTIANVPVVIITGAVDGDEVAATLDVAGCVMKPYAFDPVLETVRRHCETTLA